MGMMLSIKCECGKINELFSKSFTNYIFCDFYNSLIDVGGFNPYTDLGIDWCVNSDVALDVTILNNWIQSLKTKLYSQKEKLPTCCKILDRTISTPTLLFKIDQLYFRAESNEGC